VPHRPLRIAHLYPDLLNLYADKGNIKTLVSRCHWRGIDVDVRPVHLHDRLDLQNFDMVLLGGGSDREQELIGRTLHTQRIQWKAAVEDGMVLLAVCGGYQLLGEYYQLPDGTKVPGLGVLNLVTTAGTSRLIGNISIDTVEIGTIVGFENHAGRTVHEHMPLGHVLQGHGNNNQDKQEGVHYHNVFGTYIHGPLLPKNPRLADWILQSAFDYAQIAVDMTPLDDTLEIQAHEAFLSTRMNINLK